MSNREPTPRQRQITEFIEALGRLDAAGRARLKRNAGRSLGEARDIHRVFYQAVPFSVHELRHEDYFLVATLFPFASHRAGGGSLGATLRRIRGASERGNSRDRRFQTLIDSEREQLPFRLRQAVRLAAANEQSIDWAQLLDDLLAWNLDGRPVQLRWARDYFVGHEVAERVEAP